MNRCSRLHETVVESGATLEVGFGSKRRVPADHSMLSRRMRKGLGTWLYLVAIGHIVAGFALPLLAYSNGFDLYAEQIRMAFWGGGLIPPEAEAFQRWIVALFGPTVASWGVLMACLVRAGMRTNAPWPWNALLLSLLAWAPADMAISLMRDFWLHVVVDLLAAIAIAVPAIVLRRQRNVQVSY